VLLLVLIEFKLTRSHGPDQTGLNTTDLTKVLQIIIWRGKQPPFRTWTSSQAGRRAHGVPLGSQLTADIIFQYGQINWTPPEV